MRPFFPGKVTVGRNIAIVQVLIVFLVIQACRSVARADDTFTQTLNNVEFKAVPTGIDSYDLDFTNINFDSSYDELLYKTNPSDGWTLLPTAGTRAFTLAGLTGQQPIWLEISDGTSALTAGELQFTGPAGTNLYNGLDVTWQLPAGTGGLNLSVVTPSGTARLSPIPIPASGILFGSGLLGLIGLGIRKGRREGYPPRGAANSRFAALHEKSRQGDASLGGKAPASFGSSYQQGDAGLDDLQRRAV